MQKDSSLCWNYFWDDKNTQKFCRMSWSKRRMIEIITPFLRPDKKILDAGCGSGFFSKFFSDSGLDSVAVDFSQAALRLTAQKTQGRVQTVEADLLSDDFSSKLTNNFDVVFSDGLLEHFTKPQQCQILKNFNSLLVKNGVVITFVPNFWSPWQLLRPFVMPGIKECPFQLKDLIEIHNSNGFSVLNFGGINVLPWKFSPEKMMGKYFGMLLYVIGNK